MRRLRSADIWSLERYEAERPTIRGRYIAVKNRLRLALGEHLTLLFENRDTVWYQIQEMIRIERLVKVAEIQHEIDTYNELLPQRGELSATLLVEYSDPIERDAALRSLLGLDRHVWLALGERKVPATFDARQIGRDRFSAVQFLRFFLGDVDADELKTSAARGDAFIEVDHAFLTARAPLAADLVSALVLTTLEEDDHVDPPSPEAPETTSHTESASALDEPAKERLRSALKAARSAIENYRAILHGSLDLDKAARQTLEGVLDTEERQARTLETLLGAPLGDLR